MNESKWFIRRNEELMEQVTALREHAAREESPWAVSLRMLESEIRDSFDKHIALLKSYEQKLETLENSNEEERGKLLADHLKERALLDEAVTQLKFRIGEMEKLRQNEAYRVKKSMTFKEAELERLRRMTGIDAASLRKRRLLKIAAAAAIVLLALAAGGMYLMRNVYWRQREYSLPYANPSALAIAEGELLVSDWLTQSLYFHSLEDGLPLHRVVLAPNYHFSGLAMGDGMILAADKWTKKILTLHLKGPELQEVSAIPCPGPKPGGLFLEEDAFWSADAEAGKIFRHRNDGVKDEVKEYSLGPLHPRALLRRDEILWVLDALTGKVYRNRPGPDLDKHEAWLAVTTGFPSDGPQPVSIAADKESLWVLTIKPARLYRYNFRYLDKISAD